MNILMCTIIVPVIFVLIMLGLLVINEVVEDLKKINKMRKNNEWSNSTIRVMGYNYRNPNSRNNMWGAKMNCPICGANMTEFEKKTFDNRCSDCYSDVWAAENIGEKQSIEQVENMIKIFKSMKRKEPDKYIKASYDYAIKSYEKQLENLKNNE